MSRQKSKFNYIFFDSITAAVKVWEAGELLAIKLKLMLSWADSRRKFFYRARVVLLFKVVGVVLYWEINRKRWMDGN